MWWGHRWKALTKIIIHLVHTDRALPKNQAHAKRPEMWGTDLTWLLPSWSLQLLCTRDLNQVASNINTMNVLWRKTLGALRESLSERVKRVIRDLRISLFKELGTLAKLNRHSFDVYSIMRGQGERWGWRLRKGPGGIGPYWVWIWYSEWYSGKSLKGVQQIHGAIWFPFLEDASACGLESKFKVRHGTSTHGFLFPVYSYLSGLRSSS